MRGVRPFTLIFCQVTILAVAVSGQAHNSPDGSPLGSQGGTILQPGSAIKPCTDGREKGPRPRRASFFPHNAPIEDFRITIDMNPEDYCLPNPINFTVPNKQEITLTVTRPNGMKCSVVEATKQVTPPDIGSMIANFLKSAGPAVSGAPPSSSAIYALPAMGNSQATITISCKDDDPDKVMMPKKTVIVTYQNIAPISASAGSIVSLLGKKTYGVNTTVSSVTAGGAVTSQYAIGVTSSSTVQYIPAGFLNLYGVGNRNTHLDLQAGVGINPNGSKVKVEYFIGPAFAWKGLYVSPGLHLAQAQYLANGYTVGDTVSSQTFSVPTVYHTTLRFGFAISYTPKLPSKSAQSVGTPSN